MIRTIFLALAIPTLFVTNAHADYSEQEIHIECKKHEILIYSHSTESEPGDYFDTKESSSFNPDISSPTKTCKIGEREYLISITPSDSCRKGVVPVVGIISNNKVVYMAENFGAACYPYEPEIIDQIKIWSTGINVRKYHYIKHKK